MKRVQFLPLQSFDIHVFRVRTGKNREHLKYLKNVYCVMANHRTGSRSGHANWRQNHELINVVARRLVFSRLIGFSRARQ